MSFQPGKVVDTLEIEGQKVQIRYPEWTDLKPLHTYINALSKEDVYMLLSGENISIDDESDFLAQTFQTLEAENGVYLELWIDEQLAGVCVVERDQNNRSRRLHVAKFGISIGAPFRGKGFGELLARRTIGEAAEVMDDLQIIELHMFGANCPARKLYEKLGFQVTGTQMAGLKHKGENQDYVWMSLYL